MKKLFNCITNWVMANFFTMHCKRTYGTETLEYQVTSEVITDKETILKTNRILGGA